ncbi:MAG: histidine kinase [Bacteroidia bacterium]
MIFFALYIIHDRYYSEKRANASEREKLINELNFLKAQLNPHFLFNAINSIYVLIDEDKKLASKTLLKFSALLRYQLYDCTQDWMPVEREFEFIKDYVDLEKMRNNDNLDVSFKFSDQTLNLQIAPFILLPFVENAFKHRSYNIQDNSVVITANFKDNFLVFSVTNSYDEFKIKKDEGGGIGLLNVYRRLQLAYPDKHKIDVSKKEGKYKINLELQLYENALYNSR